MPVTIRELVIKASVEIGGKQTMPATSDAQGIKPLDRKALIQACVEEVLKVLERKEER